MTEKQLNNECINQVANKVADSFFKSIWPFFLGGSTAMIAFSLLEWIVRKLSGLD